MPCKSPQKDKNTYDGVIAQLVEQRTENPCVPGSIPGDTTKNKTQVIDNQLFGFFLSSTPTQSCRQLAGNYENIRSSPLKCPFLKLEQSLITLFRITYTNTSLKSSNIPKVSSGLYILLPTSSTKQCIK